MARNDQLRSAISLPQGQEDQAIEIPIIELLKNDCDVEGFALQFETRRAIRTATSEITDHGTIIFTPDADFWGEASFNYLVTDPEGAVDGANVTLWFENVGDAPPVARDDTIYVYEDIPTVIPIAALLGNDTDIDRDPLEFVSWRLSRHLQVRRDADGTLDDTMPDGDILFTPSATPAARPASATAITDNADGDAPKASSTSSSSRRTTIPTAMDDEGFVTPLDIPLVIRVCDLLFNDFDIEQVDTDGDGIRDDDLDDPDRPRPRFVGVDAVLDPAELAHGHRVRVGEFEIVELRIPAPRSSPAASPSSTGSHDGQVSIEDNDRRRPATTC